MQLESNKQYIISKLGNDYKPAPNYEIRYKCPFCEEYGKRNDDYKLYVNYKSGKYFCQRCESKGRFTISSEFGNNTDVYNILNKYLNPDKHVDPDEEPSDYYLIPKNKLIPGYMSYDYMISRGFSDEDIKKYDMRVAGLDDKEFQGRIVIPNKVISNIFTDMYTSRSYIGHDNKYKNPFDAKKTTVIFNYHNIPDNPDELIINEGPLNSIIAGDTSIALYGKYASSQQINMIVNKHPKVIYVSLDRDAYKQAVKLCETLSGRLVDTIVKLVELPMEIDAVDLGKKAYREFINDSKVFYSKSMYTILKSIGV